MHAVAPAARGGGGVARGQLLATYLFNGVNYALYNQMSFLVLGRSATSTHAVLNVFRRVVVIGLTSLYFRTGLTPVRRV